MSVHYKFKSNLDHDTVTFDGLNISVADLKKSIMHQKKIGKSSDFDLQITNAQTKEVYDNDEMLVPKNTSVIVARVPVQGGSKKNWNEKPDLPLPIGDDDLGRIRYDRIAKSADLVNSNTSEEDKVKAMITQSSQEYDPSKYVKSRSMTGPLPPTYTCFRCGKQGHWIKNCPTNNPDVKRSTGIPRSFMVPVDGPEHKGALLTSSGEYAVPLIDHQAYKEVKKEKPPFVPQDEPVVEPEAEIPEELLCMVCKDLLQDAVLIPCCGNSFCDECVRSVLLESDNHECPVCHEIDVSPNTLIPNRFLRTAVLNYKNETGYTRVKRAVFVKSPSPEQANSPQPSPDSTFESQPHGDTAAVSQPESCPRDKDDKKSVPEIVPAVSAIKVEDESGTASGIHTPENVTPKGNTEDESEDVQPGTPLADEPIDGIHQHLPIQTIGQEHFTADRYQHDHKYSRNHREEYHRRRYADESHEPQLISTIGTVTNTRQKFFPQRPPPMRQPFSNQRARNDNRPENYSHERDDYHGRYDRRHNDRGSRRNMDYDRPRDSRYHQSNTHEYPVPEHDLAEYDASSHGEDSSRRHQERYRTPPRPILLPPPVPPAIYVPPVVPAIPPPHPHLLPTPPVFAPQPPPPGASPVNTAQPPPPGVGPLLPISTDAGSVFPSRPYEGEDPLKDAAKLKERSIDDRMEEFQRKLDKQDRKYTRDRGSRSRSRSVERHRSRSLSRSRSYSSSKSWTRSASRSSTRTTRSRSRTPFSSRSRTRSYSHSRSRSWSKKRSYTRSRSRTRTGSRSRSRSRTESRLRRRGVSRDRIRSPRHRTRSRSFSPKHFRMPSHRGGPYTSKHSYNPTQYGAGASYQSQFGPPQAILPIPVMRPPAFPPHHLTSMHQPIQPVHSRPIEQFPVDRPPKYPPYGDQYPVYDAYHPKYEDQRYEREQRAGDHRSMRYDKRPEYQRHQEEVAHRIPGWVGDRSREFKPRYRNTRDQRKEIRELPQIPESEMRAMQVKESTTEEPIKKKEEKVASKHKKHHHHHKSKDVKKQDSKISVVSSWEKHSESSKNLIKVELATEKLKNASVEGESKSVKSTEKGKDKKHKHKKHKAGDHVVKKKRSSKKEKIEAVPSTESDKPIKAKIKKKKIKPKAPEIDKSEEIPLAEKTVGVTAIKTEPESQPEIKVAIVTENVPDMQIKKEKPTEEQDILDIFADEPDSDLVDLKPDLAVEGNSADLENAVTEDPNVEEEIEESGNSEEEEVEEPIEEENVLRVDVPGISKWEREESEDEYSASIPQRKNSVVVTKEEKGPISSDIISRAENALIAKQFKPRIEKKGTSDSKDSSEDSSPERSPAKHKEVPELKSVVNTEQLKPDTLKVTISTNKEKRSVYTRKEESRRLQSESAPPKRSGDDRSGRYRDEQGLHRSVAVYPVREDDRVRSRRAPDGRERKRSPPREVVAAKSSSREVRDYSRKVEREIENREMDELRMRMERDERRRRFDDYRNSSNSSRDRSDRRRTVEQAPPSRSRRPQEKKTVRSSNKRSRSRSSESVSSYNSIKRKNDQKCPESAEERYRASSDKTRIELRESSRMKHSPIKPPGTSSVYTKPVKRDYHDELKFEPDYDEFSDVEEKAQDSKEWVKRKASSPEGSRKGAKIAKVSKVDTTIKRTDKTGAASSVTSSANSESDSSDSDEPKESKSKNSESDHKQKHKKSKHKKHKKHKHKHKKKKSHKSKQKD